MEPNYDYEVQKILTEKYGSVCKKCNGKYIIGSHMEKHMVTEYYEATYQEVAGFYQEMSPAGSSEVEKEILIDDYCDNCIEGKEKYVIGSMVELEEKESSILRKKDEEIYEMKKIEDEKRRKKYKKDQVIYNLEMFGLFLILIVVPTLLTIIMVNYRKNNYYENNWFSIICTFFLFQVVCILAIGVTVGVLEKISKRFKMFLLL